MYLFDHLWFKAGVDVRKPILRKILISFRFNDIRWRIEM
jgi:hypothetical protein